VQGAGEYLVAMCFLSSVNFVHAQSLIFNSGISKSALHQGYYLNLKLLGRCFAAVSKEYKLGEPCAFLG